MKLPDDPMTTMKTQTHIASIFGTRPEAIKFAPVLKELETRADRLKSHVLLTTQHTDLLEPFVGFGRIVPDAVARIERDTGSLNEFLAGALSAIDKHLEALNPDLVLVQGDTSSTLAGAMAAFNRGIPVGHIEAGLRSGERRNPFPEEMNRQMVSRIADLHFAATTGNRDSLLAENIDPSRIILTGNPIVDALRQTIDATEPSPRLKALLHSLEGQRILAVTTHRRENFGARMTAVLGCLRDFVAERPDMALVLPVHPNPAVRLAIDAVFAGQERIHLIEPLDHSDFLHLMRASWVIASDSGGVQEEAVSLARRLLVLRDTTERMEAIRTGSAWLTGTDPNKIRVRLDACERESFEGREGADNPFGDGFSAAHIADAIEDFFGIANQSATPKIAIEPA